MRREEEGGDGGCKKIGRLEASEGICTQLDTW